MNETKTRSTAGGHFFLGNTIHKDKPIFLNGSINKLCKVIHIAASVAEAELGSLFLNAQEAVKLRIALQEMGHTQPPTPIHTENSTATRIIYQTIKQQSSREMNMRYPWTIRKQQDRTIDVSWYPGQENLDDYTTKHHPPNIYQNVRPIYLHMYNSPIYLQRSITPHLMRGCTKTLARSLLRTHILPYRGMVPTQVQNHCSSLTICSPVIHPLARTSEIEPATLVLTELQKSNPQPWR